MAEQLLPFQKFNDLALAEQMASQLNNAGIECIVENNQNHFDISFANNKVDYDISVKLKPEDFPKARKTLEDYYNLKISSVEKDYYLFDFTDAELMEIVSNADEWGYFDYELSQKILKERGIQINDAQIELLKRDRINKLSKPLKVDVIWIWLGYIMGIFGWILNLWGGLIGVAVAVTLISFRKTLPNGKVVYVYDKDQREQGYRMLFISVVGFLCWITFGFALVFRFSRL